MKTASSISFSRQCFYLVLHLTGLVCGLWLVHDPLFTVSMLLLAPASLLLSRLPVKIFPVVVRQIVQCGYGFAAVYWLQKYLPVRDFSQLIVEFGCIVFPSLYLLRSRREHNMMLLGVMGIVFYGSLHPNRTVFFPSFLAVLLFLVLLLYQTRISFLGLKSGNGQQLVLPETGYRRNPLYFLAHFICSLILTVILISQFSLTRRFHSLGLIPGDWQVRQELKFPAFWNEWRTPLKRFLPGEHGRKIRSSDQTLPVEIDRKNEATRLISGDSSQSLQMNGNGGSLGDSLVFRAVSPVKMYWMVQAYDTYDGNRWTRSLTMQKGRGRLDTFEPEEFYLLPQKIVMEHPVSRMLPYVYQPVRLDWAEPDLAGGYEDEQNLTAVGGIIRHKDHILYEVINSQPPPLPWRYAVSSRIPNPELKAGLAMVTGPENRNCGWNYLQFPRKKISARMRRLARDLTGGTDDKMEKATILRDYLKHNFRYNLAPGRIPDSAEVCDYFLFESREGYCQHFAQALTVLARLAGLQSRLAVGYAPGNYNFLTNCFEVYEYHGHAWTQIFIPPYGWLTFDGTPPGSVPDMAGPRLLQKLLDPFGERQDARPPEISSIPQGKLVNPEVQRLEMESGGTGETVSTLAEVQEKMVKVYDEIYAETARECLNREPGIRDLARTGFRMLLRKLQEFQKKIREAVLLWRERWRKFLALRGAELRQWLKSLSLWDYGCMLGGLILLRACWSRRRQWERFCAGLWRKWRCRRLWRKLQKGQIRGRSLVEACQQLVFFWLEACGIRRLPYQDVFEYGENLRGRKPELFGDYSLLADFASRCWYGPAPLSDDQCRQALQATDRLRKQLDR